MSALVSAPGKASDLVFDPAEHAYYFRGVRVVSVTQAIASAGLIDDTWFTEFARERGRLVHLATALDDEGDLDCSTLDPVLQPYLEAYRKFRAETGFVPQVIESQFIVIDQGYAGTLDRYGLIGKRRVLPDLKTGPVPPWGRLQTAAYTNSFPNGSSIERVGVELRDDGTYKATWYPIGSFRQDLNDFLVTVRIHQLKGEMGCQQWQ